MGEYILKEIVKNKKKFITISIESKDILWYEIKMIKYNKELPMLNISEKYINDITELSYDINGYISIADCMEKMLIQKKSLVNILIKIVSTLIVFNDYFLNINNIIFNINNVYYNLDSNEIKFIYVPVSYDIKDNSINRKVLLLELLFAIKNCRYNDENLQKAISDVRDDLGSLVTLKKYLINIQKKLEKSSMEKVTADKDKGKILKNKKKEIEENVTTDIVNYNKLTSLYMMILERGSSREIELVEETYLIGRLEAIVDIPIKSNNVGRIHGRIERDKNNYYYIDLNSKNGSFINNEKLIPNKRYLISNGTKLMLANITIEIINNRGM